MPDPTTRPTPDKPRPAPDAFFPRTPRRRVVLLGAVMIVLGLPTAFVLVPYLGSIGLPPRMSGIFFFLALGIVGFKVVCLLKKPTTGSAPGSARYNRLVDREDEQRWRNSMRFSFWRKRDYEKEVREAQERERAGRPPSTAGG